MGGVESDAQSGIGPVFEKSMNYAFGYNGPDVEAGIFNLLSDVDRCHSYE